MDETNDDLHAVYGYLDDGLHQLAEAMTLGGALTMMIDWDEDRRSRAFFFGGPLTSRAFRGRMCCLAPI